MQIFIENIIIMSFSAIIIALLMLLLSVVGRRAFSGMWHQAAWILVMLLLVFPISLIIGRFNPSLPFATRTLHHLKSSLVEWMGRPIFPSVREEDLAPGNRYSTFGRLSIANALFVVWAIGFIVLSTQRIVSYIRFKKTIIDMSVTSDERWWFAIPDNVRAKIKLRDAGIPSPFVFGVFRPVVIMPSHAVSKENVSYALMHELLHVERRDLLTKSIAEIVAILHWLNPAAWLIRNQINLACENACDEAVAERLDEQERKAYARAILDFMDVSVVPAPLYPATLASFSGEEAKIKKRLEHIIAYKPMTKWSMVMSALLIMLVALCAVFTSTVLAAETRATIPEMPVQVAVDTVSEVDVLISSIPEVPEYPSYSDQAYIYEYAGYVLVGGTQFSKQIEGRLAENEKEPKYSEDGKKVVFMVDSDLGQCAYLFNGDSCRMLSDHAITIRISNNGSQIAVIETTDQSEKNVLKLFDLDGFEAKVIDEGPIVSVCFSPNGQNIAYTLRTEEGGAISRVIDALGQIVYEVPEAEILAIWDKGGHAIVCKQVNGDSAIVWLQGDRSELLCSFDSSTKNKGVRIIADKRWTSMLVIGENSVSWVAPDGRVVSLASAESEIHIQSLESNRISYAGTPIVFETITAFEGKTFWVTDELTNSTQKIVALDFPNLESERIEGKAVAFSEDGMHAVFGVGELYYWIDAAKTEPTVTLLKGTLSQKKACMFSDKTLYYLTDDGKIYSANEEGANEFLRDHVDDFRVVGSGDSAEIYYLSEYSENVLTNDEMEPIRFFGRKLSVFNPNEPISRDRVVADYVNHWFGSVSAVFYECVTQRTIGEYGCVSDIHLYCGSDGHEFRSILHIG